MPCQSFWQVSSPVCFVLDAPRKYIERLHLHLLTKLPLFSFKTFAFIALLVPVFTALKGYSPHLVEDAFMIPYVILFMK